MNQWRKLLATRGGGGELTKEQISVCTQICVFNHNDLVGLISYFKWARYIAKDVLCADIDLACHQDPIDQQGSLHLDIRFEQARQNIRRTIYIALGRISYIDARL